MEGGQEEVKVNECCRATQGESRRFKMRWAQMRRKSKEQSAMKHKPDFPSVPSVTKKKFRDVFFFLKRTRKFNEITYFK